LKARILKHWDEIQELAAGVPGPEQMADLLARAGGATQPSGLNLTDEEVNESLQYAHYLRNRFTVRKLVKILGME
jgi:glycerol-1-phosphate dehydrogenase [NAD(P)+]